MWLRAAFVLGGLALSVSASAPVGIPRELARERAAVLSNLRYNLSFDLTLRDDAAAGTRGAAFLAFERRTLCCSIFAATMLTIS